MELTGQAKTIHQRSKSRCALLTGPPTCKRLETFCRILLPAFTIARPSKIFRLPKIESQRPRFTLGEPYLVTQIQDFIDKFMLCGPELDMTDADGAGDPIRMSLLTKAQLLSLHPLLAGDAGSKNKRREAYTLESRSTCQPKTDNSGSRKSDTMRTFD